jgi:hypothetical protein
MYFAGRLGLAVSALVTEDLTIRAALRRSWQLSRGHVVEILGSMYGSVLLGTSGLLAVNYVPSAAFGRYRQLVSLTSPEAEKAKIHWLNWLFVIIFPVLGAIILTIYVSIVVTAVNQMQNQPPATTTQNLYN